MRQIETTGATREEAIQKALEELGVEMADVKIEIIDEGSKGFLGIGSRPVKVRVTVEKNIPEEPQKTSKQSVEKGSKKEKVSTKQPRSKGKEMMRNFVKVESDKGSQERSEPSVEQEKSDMSEQPPEEQTTDTSQKEEKIKITEAQGNEASALLREMLEKMGIPATVKFVRTEEGVPKLEIESQDGALLIGRKGAHLETIQFLINRMFFGIEEGDSVEKFVVDTENYLARRRETLRRMALDLAEKAKRTGRNVKLPPMPSHERRIIHVTLQNDRYVETYSVGKDENRYVVIAPKNRRAERKSRSNRGRKDYRDHRDRRDRYYNNKSTNRRQQDRKNSRRDYKQNWKKGRPTRSPYSDDIDPGQVSE